MEFAGWFLIISGVIWIFYKTWIETNKPNELTIAFKQGDDPKISGITLPADAFAKLAAAPYGAGLVLVVVGATLLMAGSGFSVSFSGAVPSPSPTPT